MSDLVQHYRKMARNNAFANHRLFSVCSKLTDVEFAEKRTGFFPSLQATLNHLLTVDWYYLDALEGRGLGLAVFSQDTPFPRVKELWRAQNGSDKRLISYCEGLNGELLKRRVNIDRGEAGVTSELISDTLAHLFQHQIHHRGQAHAMLSSTRLNPPQLDEYFLAFDAERRTGDLAALNIEGPEAFAPARPSANAAA